MTEQITVPRATWDAMRGALEGIMRWQVKNVNVWHNSAYDIAHDALTAANAVSAEPKACDMGAMCLDCQPRGKHGECPDQQEKA